MYREDSRGFRSLTGCRWDGFPFHVNLLCWNDIGNSLYDIKHKYILHILISEYK